MVTSAICGRCGETITSVWQVVDRLGLVLCGAAGCTNWARAQGMQFAYTGVVGAVVPTTPRARPVRGCAACKGPLPRPRDQFRHEGLRLCSLTCLQDAVSRPDLTIEARRRRQKHAESRA